MTASKHDQQELTLGQLLAKVSHLVGGTDESRTGGHRPAPCLGGLCCGAFLAKRGFPVTIAEQHSIPGGYARSFNRAGGKFTFDVSLHQTSANGDTLQLLRELGVLEKIELVKIPNFKRIISQTFDIRISTVPEQKMRYLIEEFPHEKEGIKRYFAEIPGVFDELESLKINKDNQNFPLNYPKLWNIKGKTIAAFVDAYIDDPGLKEFLTSRWGAYGLPPSKLSAFFYVIGSLSTEKEPCYIKTRSQDLSDALAETVTAFGGQILYKTRIEKITMENKAVSGVVTAKGKHIPAKIIISNASAITTFNKMLPPTALPRDYIDKINGFRPSISTFTVWLGLNREINKTIKDCRIAVSSGRAAEADYISCLKGEVEEIPASVTIYDNYYKGYSKSGTSTIAIVTMSGYQSWQRFESDYKAGRKKAYKKEKEKWTATLIQKVEERAIPGLSSMVEVAVAATQLTNWHYTRNTAGAVYGFEQSVHNSFMDRIKNKTPIQGLYLASAWGNPGGGYTSALRAGKGTFEEVLKDLILP